MEDYLYEVREADPSGYWIMPEGCSSPECWTHMETSTPINEIIALRAKLKQAEADIDEMESALDSDQNRIAELEKEIAALLDKLKIAEKNAADFEAMVADSTRDILLEPVLQKRIAALRDAIKDGLRILHSDSPRGNIVSVKTAIRAARRLRAAIDEAREG